MALTRPRAYQIYDIDYKQAVRVVTTTNITLSGGAPNQVDGVNLVLNDRILVTGQSTGSQNGIYYVTTLGSGSNGTWTRSIDTNNTGELLSGTIVMVTEGLIYADTQWKLTTDDPITIGSTSLIFVQNYSANSISSGTSNVSVTSNANVSVAVAGSNVAVFAADAQYVTGNIIPTANVTYNLGSATNRFKDLYIANNSIYIGNVTVGATATDLTVNGATVVTASGSSTLSLTGNITGGNLISNGLITSTGNATFGNLTTTIANFTTFNSSIGGNVTGTLVATSANAQFINQTNGAGYVSVAGYISAAGNVTGGNVLTGGLISATGNITGGNVSGSLLTGTLTTTSQPNITSVGTLSSLTVTANTTSGNLLTGGLISATSTITSSANITGGNINTAGQVSSTGNVTGGNLITAGQISSTGTITSNGSTNGTAFAVGNSAVSNVALGFFPTAGTAAAMAIRDYSTVASTIYFDVGMGGATAGSFQFRTTNSFTTLATIDSNGITTTNRVYALELNSTQSSGDEGGQINLSIPATNTSISTGVVIDVYQNKLRFYEGGGTARGAYLDITGCGAGVSTNLLSGGGGGSPGGSNTYVQFNDDGAFGGNGQFVYNKVTNIVTAGAFAANTNGTGQNFKVGDDAWLGDVNASDTVALIGQQNAANGYIVFGNADNSSKLGRAGSGPLTYAGAFSATGNVSGGNLIQDGTRVIKWTTVANTAPTNAVPGDFWYDSYASIKYQYTNDGTSNVWIDQSSPTTFSTITVGSILNSNANGVGNIGTSGGSFNTVFAKATSAQYADLAEIYETDVEYPPGTVVIFGGEKEITISTQSHDTRVAGVISTQPAYIMNSMSAGLPVAFTGRVPCYVQGPVSKGDVLVSGSLPGTAQRLGVNYQPGCVIGKSLESIQDNSIQIIEVVVGRF